MMLCGYGAGVLPVRHFSVASHRFSARPSVTPHPSRMSSGAPANAAGTEEAASTTADADVSIDVLVQYVVLRRDLIDTWPLGSVVAQGCHAALAAVWLHRDHADTLTYCGPTNLDSMHKVTLEVKGEQQLRNLAEKLGDAGVRHKLWVEQPENIPTCLATAPAPRSQVSQYLKKLKLCK